MLLKLLLFVTAVGLASTEDANPVVTVADGVLKGAWKTSTKGRTYASFLGVPYAQPPVGEYRFREPQEVTPWDGTWDATEPLSACIQYDPFTKSITGDEDCLYLNIHSPNTDSSALLPVVIFIHGGAFLFGQGAIYGPSNLMDSDIVLITMNYRLGPMGFTSTGDKVIPGNYGLKDQLLALRWIKDNIIMFGGNPDSITLTGHAAGAASVHYHYLSPQSRGLFNRGIAFSGSGLSSWTFTVNPAEKAKTLATLVGCSNETSEEIRDCLRNTSAEAIISAQIDMFVWTDLFTPFVPSIEPSDVPGAFLTKHPYQASIDGDMMNIPLIVSDTSEDGLFPAASFQYDPSTSLVELEAGWSHLASDIFQYGDLLPLSQQSDVAAKIKEHYLAGEAVSQETFPQLVKAFTDYLFLENVGRLAEIHASKSGVPTYYYKYLFRATASLTNLMANNTVDYGVCHGDDVIYIFNYPSIEAVTSDDFQMIDNFVDMIYSYASTGVPVMPGSDTEWLPVDPNESTIKYLNIISPTNTEMAASSDFGQRSFWSSLGFNQNENYVASCK